MQLETDLTSNECEYMDCRHNLDGECMSAATRRDCVEIALRVLSVVERAKYAIDCEFCADIEFHDLMMQRRVERLNNRKKHPRKIRARRGVRFSIYGMENHAIESEKLSKLYQVNYCPVCGRLLDHSKVNPSKVKEKK